MTRASKQSAEDSDPRALLRQLPGVDEVLEAEPLKELTAVMGHGLAAHHARATIAGLREAILANGAALAPEALTAEAVARRSAERWRRIGTPLPGVINGTGVILHSGLGRAPLSPAATQALERGGGYALLEVERSAGARLSRDTRIGELLRELTGADASLVVNNNAAATLLMLAALAGGKEVICSRGEMVEIGGSYRIPDVMAASGCRLVEVGCTNRTHTRDYAEAIGQDTGALLVVHTSNYRVQGFTSTPPLEEIVSLGRQHGLPVLHDLGSGSLLSPEELGVGDEPPVSQSLKAGCDVVTMSGDKLLGGPQAGIILGSKEPLQRMRNHPLARALRIDKLAVAALEATLQLFLDRDRLLEHHTVLRLLTRTPEDLRPRAEVLAAAITQSCGERLKASVLDVTSEAGSGALPTLQIPSVGIALAASALPAAELGRRLRLGPTSVFTRIVQDRVCLDLRTLFPDDDVRLPELVASALEDPEA